MRGSGYGDDGTAVVSPAAMPRLGIGLAGRITRKVVRLGLVAGRGAGLVLTGALAPAGIAPPLANLGNSVAHREALLG